MSCLEFQCYDHLSMRFLSVAERELRAGARHKATYRSRWVTAGAFLALLAWLIWVFSFRPRQVFQIYSTLSFFFCLIFGAAQTADCLSSEKREGTLGLLFLTNLNGLEIIGGKLCSSALAAAYGLFAIFPLLALQMLMGGVTLGHFWRTVLALVNAIFLAVATGFLASSLFVRQFTAIAAATGMLLFASLGLAGLSAAVRALRGPKLLMDGLAILSPLFTLNSAPGIGLPNLFWWSFLAVMGLSWSFLALAAWRVSWSWRDRPVGRRAMKMPPRWSGWGRAGRTALRQRLLTINPFFWLGGRFAISAPFFMLFSLLIVAVTSHVAAPVLSRVIPFGSAGAMAGHLFAWVWATVTIHGLVFYYAATIASRRLAEDKQSGALELVLSTPISVRSISRGLWLAYARTMFFPVTVAILTFIFLMWQIATMAVLDPPSPALPRGTTPGQLIWHVLLDRPIGNYRIEWGFILVSRLAMLCLLLAVFVWITLGWVARWFGLRMKRPGFAPILSLALIGAPPVILFSFVVFCFDKMHLTRMPQRLLLPLMMWIAFSIGTAHCLMLSWWAAARLLTDFRTVVTSRFQPSSTRPWWRPTKRGGFRFAARFAAGTAVVFIIVLSFYRYQNWRTRRAWSALQNQLKRSGQSLDVARLLPAIVNDSQNFALTPAFRNWVNPVATNDPIKSFVNGLRRFDFASTLPSGKTAGIDWIGQASAPLDDYLAWIFPTVKVSGLLTREAAADALLQALKPFDERLRELAAASHLPYFQTSTNRNALAILRVDRPANVSLVRLHMLFQVRALASLANEQTSEAAEDFLTGLRFARLVGQAPDAESLARTQILLARSLQPLWEGIVEHRWSQPQLVSFQSELARFNLLADYTNAVRRVVLANIEIWRIIGNQRDGVSSPELATLARTVDWPMQPRGWWLDSCSQLYDMGQAVIKKVDVANSRFQFDWVDLERLPLDSSTSFVLQQPYWVAANPAFVAFAQNALNQAVIACALERFRLLQGKYPETLKELLPDYLTNIPKDVARGMPMLYENTSDLRFELRSVGPNQTNDRAQPVSDDWLWSFPTNATVQPVR